MDYLQVSFEEDSSVNLKAGSGAFVNFSGEILYRSFEYSSSLFVKLFSLLTHTVYFLSQGKEVHWNPYEIHVPYDYICTL